MRGRLHPERESYEVCSVLEFSIPAPVTGPEAPAGLAAIFSRGRLAMLEALVRHGLSSLRGRFPPNRASEADDTERNERRELAAIHRSFSRARVVNESSLI